MSIEIKTVQADDPARITVVVSGLDDSQSVKARLYAVTEWSRAFVTETVSSTGGAALIDYYPPLGVDVTYEVEVAGKLAASQTVNFGSAHGWLRSSLDPTKGIKISTSRSPGAAIILFKSLHEYGYTAQGKTVRPLGSSLPVWLGSGYSEPEKTGFSLLVEGAEMARRVAAFFEDAQLLCLQALPGWGLTKPVTHFPATSKITAITPARMENGAVFEGDILPVKPPAKIFVIELTEGWVDRHAEEENITCAQVEENVATYTCAEVEANPALLFGSGGGPDA